MDNRDHFERFGKIIDELENIRYALNMPIEDKIHVQCMRNALPEKVEQLRQVYILLSGTNPWDVMPVFGAKLPPAGIN